MRSIAWISEKGGTGKTSSAINSAVGLAKLGNRVLILDTDPQGNASLVMLEGRPAEPPTLANVLIGDADARDAIRPTRTPGLDILPADVSLADATDALSKMIGREARLRAALAEASAGYDYVIVDTSPTRSVLTINVLVFVEEVLIPIEPGLFSLSGLGQLQTAIEEVRRYLGNRALRIAGIVLTRTRRDNVSRDVEEQLRAAFGGLVLRSAVPSNAKVEEAHGRFLSVIDYAPRSPGARAYLELVEEIVHGRTQERTGGASRGLLRPTTQPEPEAAVAEPVEPAGAAEEAEGQGRGDGAAESRATKPRRKRTPVNAGPTKGRKIHLPDDIHDRLWQLAHQRRTTVSAVAAEILDRNLPRFRVEREG